MVSGKKIDDGQLYRKLFYVGQETKKSGGLGLTRKCAYCLWWVDATEAIGGQRSIEGVDVWDVGQIR